MKHLVIFQRNWADEFDVVGFKIVATYAEVDEIREHFSTKQSDYFGTNEGWEHELLLDSFTFKEITDKEAALLESLFSGRQGLDGALFGHVPLVWVD